VADVAKYEGNDSQLNSVKDFIARGELGPFRRSTSRPSPITSGRWKLGASATRRSAFSAARFRTAWALSPAASPASPRWTISWPISGR
jgi:hypothetical protein